MVRTPPTSNKTCSQRQQLGRRQVRGERTTGGVRRTTGTRTATTPLTPFEGGLQRGKPSSHSAQQQQQQQRHQKKKKKGQQATSTLWPPFLFYPGHASTQHDSTKVRYSPRITPTCSNAKRTIHHPQDTGTTHAPFGAGGGGTADRNRERAPRDDSLSKQFIRLGDLSHNYARRLSYRPHGVLYLQSN